MPEGDFSDIAIGGNIDDEAKQLPFTRNGDVVSVDLGSAQTGDLFVRFTAHRAGACTVNATLKLGDAVLPLGAAGMSVYDVGIELPSSQVTAVSDNKATVYAAPDSRVELELSLIHISCYRVWCQRARAFLSPNANVGLSGGIDSADERIRLRDSVADFGNQLAAW